MKLYVVKNDAGNPVGNYLTREKAVVAAAYTKGSHPRVVELVEKTELVEVSEEEAKELREVATGEKTLFGLLLGIDEGNYDRIVRAYVNGYTVRKSKRYVLPMEKTFRTVSLSAETLFAHKNKTYGGGWHTDYASSQQAAIMDSFAVTDADLADAPAWVKAITPVEVKE